MDIDTFRTICTSFPAVQEDVKWTDNLCMTVGSKMFAIARLEGAFAISFKVQDEEFDELTTQPEIVPAPYLARYKWVMIEDPDCLDRESWEHYLFQSYELIRSKLPKKVLRELGL